MNPEAIRIALQHENFKNDLVSHFHLIRFWRGAGKPERGGVHLVNDAGEVFPEVVES